MHHQVIYHQAAPLEDHAAAKYRQDLFNLFLPVEGVEPHIRKKNSKRRFILNYYFNGDLRKAELQHFCDFNCCSGFDQTLRRMRNQVCWALVPTKPPLFARSRWNKWDQAVDYVGILGGVHSLLEELVLEFIKPEAEKTKATQPLREELARSVASPEDPLDEMFNHELASLSGSATRSKATSTTSPPDEQPEVSTGQPNDRSGPDQDGDGQDQDKTAMENKFDWQEFNQQQKILTRKWVQTFPFSRLCLMKQCAGPLLELMYKYLLFSGNCWEKKQQLRSAQGLQRSYGVTEKAKGHDDQQCMEKLYKLFFTKPCAFLEDQGSQEILALTRFRSLSSGLCSLHALLRLPHQNFPFKLFKLLLSDDYALEILAEPHCMRDALASVFLREYATRSDLSFLLDETN